MPSNAAHDPHTGSPPDVPCEAGPSANLRTTRHGPILLGLVVAVTVVLTALWVSSFEAVVPTVEIKPDESAPNTDVQHAREEVPAKSGPDTASATGEFKGFVKFDGQPPERKLLVRKNDPDVKDPPVCTAEDLFSEELLVNENADNGVANVVIYLKDRPKGYLPPPVPEEPVIFLEKGCRYVPHVLVLRCQQTLLVKSEDPIPHNVNHTPVRNSGLLFGQTGREHALKLEKPEWTPIPVKCDLHPWMKAHWLPLDHPFAAVTDAEGKFEITGLPPGEHAFTVWHEKRGYLNKALRVRIAVGETTEKSLSYGLADFVAP